MILGVYGMTGCQVCMHMYPMYYLLEGGEDDIAKGDEPVVTFQAVIQVVVDFI